MIDESILSQIEKAADEAGCRFFRDKTFSMVTTFGTGGSIPLLIELNGSASVSRLVPFIRDAGARYYVIGNGSNIIADDCPSDLVVLRAGRDMSDITVEGTTIRCGAGISLGSVSAAARDNSLTGMEFANGIPGNAGGALFMNAGAYGGEMKDVIVSAEAVDSDGNVRTFTRDEMELSYRHSIFMKNRYIITRLELSLAAGDKDQITQRMNELTAKRREKQPLEYRSAGSTFKRPEGAFAAALIEQCGLKGYTCGGAQVSEKHSGFVINRGDASFDDVMAVISHVQQVVKEKTGYSLECEPEIITKRSV